MAPMAQSRDKRRRRASRRPPATAQPSPVAKRRRTTLRRIVIAFLVIIGLAGILAVSEVGDESGSPDPASYRGVDRAR